MATYYVDTAGSDSNPGTSGSPFLTVTKGASVLAPGDTCYVRSGIYAQSLFDAVPTGNPSQPVTISKDPAAAAGTVTLQPPGTAARVLSFATPVSYITIAGLVLDGVHVTSDCVKITSGAHHITVADCEIQNAPNGQGVLITSEESSFNQILRCRIHDNGQNDLQHGIYINKSNSNLVESCELYNSLGYGIHQFDGPMSGNIYRRNLIHNTHGLLLSSGSNNEANYNVFYENEGDLIVRYAETNSRLYNNTAYAGTRGVWLDTTVSGITVRNCISYLHTDFNGNYINEGSGTISDHNLLGVNPMFVNAAGHNFRLLAGSPAINAGVNVGLTLDYDGMVVPIGPLPDIGAFEFGTVPLPPTNLRKIN